MVAHNASTAKCPRAWNIARTAASTCRLDWTHETSQSRILRRAAVDDMQDTPPVLAPLQSVLLSVQAHHQRRRNDRFCRCQRVEFDACSEGSEPHLADPRPMELARAGRPADRPWKRQNEFVQVLTLFKLHAKVVLFKGGVQPGGESAIERETGVRRAASGQRPATAEIHIYVYIIQVTTRLLYG